MRASIGVATAREPGGDLLRDADLAMYQAKAQGRDRVVSFDSDMHEAMLAGVAMENDLRRALARASCTSRSSRSSTSRPARARRRGAAALEVPAPRNVSPASSSRSPRRPG